MELTAREKDRYATLRVIDANKMTPDQKREYLELIAKEAWAAKWPGGKIREAAEPKVYEAEVAKSGSTFPPDVKVDVVVRDLAAEERTAKAKEEAAKVVADAKARVEREAREKAEKDKAPVVKKSYDTVYSAPLTEKVQPKTPLQRDKYGRPVK